MAVNSVRHRILCNKYSSNLTALIPHITVVFPSLTNVEPSAVVTHPVNRNRHLLLYTVVDFL